MYLAVEIQEHLARWCRRYFPCSSNGIVQFPRESELNVLLGTLTRRLKDNALNAPPSTPPADWMTGNLLVMLPAGRIKQNAEYCYLPRSAQKILEEYVCDIHDMVFHHFVEHEHNRHGLTYLDAVCLWFDKYEYEGAITEEALLKNHQRWKQRILDYKRGNGGSQLSL